MSRASSVGVVLEVEPRAQPLRTAPRKDEPFRIAIVADLGGRGDSPFDPHAHRIDRDDFDHVMARIGAAITTTGALAGMPVSFSELEDFHPDRLYHRLPLFQTLRTLRARLDDPRTFAAAARELLGDDAPPAASSPADSASGGSLLDRMVEDVAGPAPPVAGRTPAPTDDFRAHIRSLVAPHVVPGDDPRKAELVDRVDLATGDLLRSILHDPAFQAKESVWRSIHMLVRRVDTGADLQLYVIDATRADLERDAAGQGHALRRVLVDPAVESPWSVIVSDQSFAPTPRDMAVLTHLAGLARDAGAPLLAGADPRLAGCPGFADDSEPGSWSEEEEPWRAFRRSPVAGWTGLALPRLMMRLPYGRGSEECDAFEFEEMDAPPAHADYLWGSAAFACALLLADAFTRNGWAMRPGDPRDIDGLPMHVYRHNREALSKPCAEGWMTERAAEALLDRGLMPLASMKDRDSVRLVRFQCAAQPAAPLRGRWRA